ncbi:hypothetical protein SAMN05421823_104195 [Catalinimonas alkaloidigena]|uniref:DUF6249 domain-containing protein n=1 Tax=Catalinimonas alkaloidigena TaxID=1075417 RepID=A0A1G9GRS6_9BACT|nr:DUF6249 domain-containing protein [Catalinimonas alkaloidigena]SDL03367.1 hypothetical protein SAMN05421823_104195 [Catalinimonas alkaloidigena]
MNIAYEYLPFILLTVFVIVLITCIFLAFYFYHRAKAKERLVLLEKGVDMNLYLNDRRPFTFPWLRAGIVTIGLSVGFGLQAILIRMDVIDEPPYLFVLFACVGASMIVAHYVDREKNHS